MQNFSQIHQPVMLSEALQALKIRPNGIYIDGTFGRGGHSAAILEILNSQGRLICLDKDREAIAYGKERFHQDNRVSFFQSCFSKIEKIANQQGIKNKIDGILLDLGVSSPQLEEQSRGFSFMREGPLDMRMDQTQGLSACEWLNQAEQKEIAWVLRRFGEENFSQQISKKIVSFRANKPLQTTIELANIVTAAVPQRKLKKHPATKTFQAIRIFINQELQALDHVLPVAMDLLAPHGRLAMISFHSLEDRKVKQYFSAQSKMKLPKGIAILEKDLRPLLKWVIKRQHPSEEEVNSNPRARSAVMRVAEKCA